jgi:ABC-type phosphate transport system auxiliary subunit
LSRFTIIGGNSTSQQTAQINSLSTNVNLFAVEMLHRDALYEAQTQQVSMLSEQLHQSREENCRTRAQLMMKLTWQLLDSPRQQDREQGMIILKLRCLHQELIHRQFIRMKQVLPHCPDTTSAVIMKNNEKYCPRSRNLTTPMQTIKV